MQIAPGALKAVVVAYANLFLSLLFVCLKIGVRYRVTCGLGFDDALVVVAWISLIPLVVLIHLQAKNGMGYHAEELTPHNLSSVLQYFWASVWVHMIALGLSKLSILTQYLRIFLDRRTRRLTWLTMAFVIVYTLQAILVGIFVCIPVEAFWNRSIQGHCINPIISNYVNAGFNISTDLVIILIPIPALNKLQVSKNQYIALLVAFSIGGLSCIISIVRLHAVAVSFKRNDTISRNQAPAMWSAIEVALAIICACLPPLRPILMRGLHALGFASPSSRSHRSKSKLKTNPAAHKYYYHGGNKYAGGGPPYHNNGGNGDSGGDSRSRSRSRPRRNTPPWFLEQDNASAKNLNSRWSLDDDDDPDLERHSLPDVPSPTFSARGPKDAAADFIELERPGGDGGVGGQRGPGGPRGIRVKTKAEWASFEGREECVREREKKKIGRIKRRV
ncbi:uncharacterized protein IWZ02DRAFT_229168 [Phyllosticta citriasiana]|uniref:uncharacterized protein n=1 Tax=Phyllosticta citriasiana TaxID=595635 RepID=UPI0030FD848A